MSRNYFARAKIILGYPALFFTNDAYVPYIHLIIAVLMQASIFGSLIFDRDLLPAEYIQTCTLVTSLEYLALDPLRVVAVAIAFILVFDLLLDLYSLRVIFRKTDSPLVKLQSSVSWKEFTIRCMFIVSFLEPNLIMISVGKERYKVTAAIAAIHVQHGMIYCTSMFIMAHAFQTTPFQRGRNFLLSLTFCSSQIISFFTSMEVCPLEWRTAFAVSILALDMIPCFAYLAICLCYSKALCLRLRTSVANSQISTKEGVFLINFLASLSWFILRFSMFTSKRVLYFPQLVAINLITFDVTILLAALLASIIRAWLARLESKKAQLLVSTTKRNVTENLTYPLLEISVGLNILLASANNELDIDVEGRKNLSRIALACNMAVNALDDMAYSEDCYTTRTESVTVESRRFSTSVVGGIRNFDPPGSHRDSITLPVAGQRKRLPRHMPMYRRTGRGKPPVIFERDFDSEVSEIHDIQSRLSARLSTKSLNFNTDHLPLSCPPSECRGLKRPSINLLATNNQSRSSMCEEKKEEKDVENHSMSLQPLRQLGAQSRARLKKGVASLSSGDEKNENGLSDDTSVVESAKNNVSSMSSTAAMSLNLFGNKPSLPMLCEQNIADEQRRREEAKRLFSSPALGGCASSLSIKDSPVPFKPDPRSLPISISTPMRPHSIQLCNTYSCAPDPYSPMLSVISAAMSSQLIIAPVTPLQLYCSMADQGSIGFECPFSLLAPSNQKLLDLLCPSPRGNFTTEPRDVSDISFKQPPNYSNIPVSKSTSSYTNCHIVAPIDVPRKVLLRSLSSLANTSFTPIQTTSIGYNSCDSSDNNRLKCDMLSEFTWRLLQVFHGDLKSTLNVFEVFLSSFESLSSDLRAPLRTTIQSQNTSPGSHVELFSKHPHPSLSGMSSGPTPPIFSHPTLLKYEALCGLEEYLSGTLVLFVKASASLLAAVDNVAVMKERRRRGIF